MSTVMYRFQEWRPDPPPDAETLVASDFERTWTTASRNAPGTSVHHTQQTCPACRRDVDIEHGMRVRCECTLTMELYGNALTIWYPSPDDAYEDQPRWRPRPSIIDAVLITEGVYTVPSDEGDA